MPDVTQGLRGGGPPPSQRQTVAGYVSAARPAPATLGDPLYVTLPDHSPDYSIEVRWAAIHGQTLPAPGAAVLVAFDDQGRPHAAWWDGIASFPSPGGGGAGAFHYVQGTPAAVWTIAHHLGVYPDVQCFTSAYDEIEGDVRHVDTDQLTVTFSAPFAGDAYCN